MSNGQGSGSPRGFFLFAAAGFVSMTSMRLCDALLPDFAQSFDTTAGAAAGTISAFVIAYGILQLVYGPLGDRYGKPLVISLAVGASALINLALVFAPSLTAVVVLRAVAGAAAAGVIPLCMAHIGDSVAYAERQAVLARFLAATIFGMIAGQWLGGLFADVLDWRSAFALMAIMFGMITVPLLRALPRRSSSATTANRQGFVAQTVGVVRIPWARLILVLALLEGALVFSALVFIPTFLYRTFHLPLTAAGAIVAAFGAGGLLYAFGARRLIARMGERGLALYGGLLQALGFATLVFSPHWVWAIPACFIAGMGFYMLHNTLQANATQMAPQARGTGVSLFACSLFLGQSLGISLVALMVDYVGVTAVFVLNVVALPLLGGWFYYRLARR